MIMVFTQPIKANAFMLQNLNKIMNNGEKVPTKMVYNDGTQAHALTIGTIFEEYIVDEFYDIYPGFYNAPIQTYRPTALISSLKEMQWIYFMQSNKLDDLKALGIAHWWDKFLITDDKVFEGTIGKAYGYTVAKHKLLDNFMNNVRQKPYARDLMLSLWQEEENQYQRKHNGLLPCVYQFKIDIKEKEHYNSLKVTLYQRSSDYLTANSINKFGYFSLILWVVNKLNNFISNSNEAYVRFNKKPVRFHKMIHIVDDLHIYDRHVDEARGILNTDSTTINQAPTLVKYTEGVGFYNSFNIIKPSINREALPLELAGINTKNIKNDN